MANEIPVYLFVGFLESGKTKFIQETFEDPNFDSGDKTLLLVCDSGFVSWCMFYANGFFSTCKPTSICFRMGSHFPLQEG